MAGAINRLGRCLVLAASLSVPAMAAGEQAAAVTSLQRDLLADDSATVVLSRWCADRHLADPPVVRAVRDPRVVRPAGAETRGLLQVSAAEPISYRHVRLVCGPHILSEADNWYVPARLTPEMNRQLQQSDTPFGSVVRSLRFRRRRLGSTAPADRGSPGYVLVQRALLTTRDGLPFSLVIERYTHDLVD